MQVLYVLHTARWKYRTQKIAKKSPSEHNRTNLSSCIFATKNVSTIGKKLVNSNRPISPICPHNMANFGPQTAQICLGRELGAPQQILTGFSSWLRYCSDVAKRRPTKLCTMFGRLLGWYTIYTFSEALSPWRNFPGAEFTYVQVLRSPILASLLYCTPTAGVSQTLWCGTRNGITELSQRAPPIFGLAAITLGIGPHSSLFSGTAKRK